MTTSQLNGDTMASPTTPDIDMASVDQDSKLVGAREVANATTNGLEKDHPKREDMSETISTTGISPAASGDQLSGFVRQRMLEEYPWVKTEDMEAFAKKCGTLMEDFITEQKPKVEATKSRVGFMSLSPELREMIYDMALISNERSVKDPLSVQSSIYYFEDDEDDEDDEDNDFYSPKYRPAIRAYVVGGSRQDHNDHGKDQKAYQCDRVHEGASAKQPALTRVSRTIRAETLPMYYAKNTFVLFPDLRDAGVDDLGPRISKGFLSGIGRHNAGLIKELMLWLPRPEKLSVRDDQIMATLGVDNFGLPDKAVKIVHHRYYHLSRGK